jgi:chorismate mutase
LAHNQCKKCWKFGHWGRECKAKPKQEEAYTAQQEESLLLLHASPQLQIQKVVAVILSVTPVVQAGRVAKAVPKSQVVAEQEGPVGGVHLVHLWEEKVFT